MPSSVRYVDSFSPFANGVQDDALAITRAIDDTPDGGTVVFGTAMYGIGPALNAQQGIRVARRRGLTFRGDGWNSILRRLATFDDQRLFTFGDDTGATRNVDITFQDLAFDFNGVGRFGGVVAYYPQGWRIIRCRGFDSALRWPGAGLNLNKDHLFITALLGTDIWVEDNESADVELVEADACRRVTVINNTCLRPAGTAPIGMYAVDPTGANNFAFDYVVEGNRIIDPRNAGILFSQEDACGGAIISRVSIANNNIVHDTIAGGTSIGMGYTAATAITGNDWSRIAVRDNRITCVHPDRAAQALFARHNQVSMRFRNVSWERNYVHGTSSDDQVLIRQQADYIIKDNNVYDAVRAYRLEILSNGFITNNLGDASSRAFANVGTEGTNRISGNRIRGNPATGWLRDVDLSTDVYKDNDGIADFP